MPKPVIGLTTGVYSDEIHDSDHIRRRFQSGCHKMGETIQLFCRLKTMQPIPTSRSLSDKIRAHRINLHLCLESFYSHLDGKKMIKKCLISENPQAAAKICLLKDRNILQAFEMTLQACIKQKPSIQVQKLSQHIFEAFDYYIHYNPEKEADEDDEDEEIVPVKRRLLERLIACWQDQKFSFIHLERLILERSTPTLLQTLVLTLFCPNEDRDCEDGEEGPTTSGNDATGPKLVDMFTPEFCLKIGDTFVKSFRTEVPESMDRWIQTRTQQNSNGGEEVLETRNSAITVNENDSN